MQCCFRANKMADKSTRIIYIRVFVDVSSFYSHIGLRKYMFSSVIVTIWESDKNTRKHHTQERQKVSPFPAGDDKVARNRQDNIT